MDQSEELISRYFTLFRGNQRSVGRFNPNNGKMHTDHEAPVISDIKRHIAGEYGVGIVPIMDDNCCWWGAIDIDNHGQDEDIPIGPIDQSLLSSDAQAIPCRSKSGGVHVYVFFDKPWPASRVKLLLTMIAKDIKYPNAEIFPKQNRLAKSSGDDKQRGNWLNMPYFGGDAGMRYAYRNGKKLGLASFLDLAESMKMTDAIYAQRIRKENPDAPPCVQQMLIDGVGKGQRNEGLYQITVYAKKAFPDTFLEKAREFNITAFDPPLSRAEAERTIHSASRPDYKYRCGEDPQKSLCDRDVCLKRRCGVTPLDVETQNALSELPEFSELIKYTTDPVRWEIRVNNKIITNIETEDLMDWRFMRTAAAERLMKILPLIKNQEWERILQPLMMEARVMTAPEDASVSGLVRARLREFAAKAVDMRDEKRMEDRQALLRGLPVIGTRDGVRVVIFRAQDFVQYLKRMKSEELRGVNLWFAVRELGIEDMKMRVSSGKPPIHVWYLPVHEVEMDNVPDEPTIKSEI